MTTITKIQFLIRKSWIKDHVKTSFLISPSFHISQLDYSSLIPEWKRDLKYVPIMDKSGIFSIEELAQININSQQLLNYLSHPEVNDRDRSITQEDRSHIIVTKKKSGASKVLRFDSI